MAGRLPTEVPRRNLPESGQTNASPKVHPDPLTSDAAQIPGYVLFGLADPVRSACLESEEARLAIREAAPKPRNRDKALPDPDEHGEC